MGADRENHIQVAGRAATGAGFALAGGAKTGAGIDAGRDLEFDAGVFLGPAFAVAVLAGMLDGLSVAPAFGAGLGDGKEAPVDGDLPLTPAGGAGDHLGAGGGTGAVAVRAGGGTADGDFFFAALHGFQEIDFKIVAEVGSLGGAGAPASTPTATPAPESVLENIAKDGAPEATRSEDFPEKLEGIVKASSGHAPARGKSLVTKAVIGIAFLRIGEDFVGLTDLLEFFLRFFIALVFVGMVLKGEFPVGLLNLLLGGAAGDPENLVVVLFCSHGSGGRWGRLGPGHGDNAGRTKETVAQLEAAAVLVEDGPLRLAGSGLRADGLVQVGIKRFADGFD